MNSKVTITHTAGKNAHTNKSFQKKPHTSAAMSHPYRRWQKYPGRVYCRNLAKETTWQTLMGWLEENHITNCEWIHLFQGGADVTSGYFHFRFESEWQKEETLRFLNCGHWWTHKQMSAELAEWATWLKNC